ncbi:MAG: calcium-binding protein [Paracoccaceae bacterium]|nr:calcium-binding protein [Paracoccaceae bacterium]
MPVFDHQVTAGVVFDLADHVPAELPEGSTEKYRGKITGTEGNDTITAHDYDHVKQTHIYAREGDDLINMVFYSGGDQYAPNNQWAKVHGHHVRGDRDGDIDRGDDTFNFVGVDTVSGIVQGRIEDFDIDRDTLAIDGVPITQSELENGSGTTAGYSWRIVLSNGDHNDPGTQPQQWLLIETGEGGYVFYALEGARVDMNGDGGANKDGSGGGAQESHFLTNQQTYPIFGSLSAVPYVDPVNHIPDQYIGSAHPDGLTINDVDDSAADLIPILGTNVADVIAAGLNNDSVQAGDGNDRVWGGSGDDTLLGEGGNDSLFGGPGNDHLIGGTENDALKGQSGDDTLDGGGGNDNLPGEEGDDSILGGAGNDSLGGGEGNDTLEGGAGDDRGGGGPGDDSIKGGDGHDSLNAGAGNDTVYGGDGNDTMNASTGDDIMYGGRDNDVFQGGDGQDTIYGNAGEDSLSGGNGNDLIRGHQDNDSVSGGAGNDTLFGGGENDTINGGAGDNLLTGGQGADVFLFNNLVADGDDTITDFTVGVDQINLIGHPSIDTYAELNAADMTVNDVSGVMLYFGDSTIFLQNVTAAQLDNDDFIF